MALRHRHYDEDEDEESGSDPASEGHRDTTALRQTFMDEDGVAIGFFIHTSVQKPSQRRNLTTDIQTNGGIVYETDDYADTVIIDDTKVRREALQLKYNCRPGCSQAAPTFVEPMSFVQRCLREGMVRHRLPLRKGMGGVVHRGRTLFTEEDEDNLCYYLSRRIPVKTLGGRFGNNVYKELEELCEVDMESYPWVARHPWQSWRERYKKHARRLDILIGRYAKCDPPSEHAIYILQRGWSSKHQRFVGPDVSDEDNESLESEEVDAEDVDLHPDIRSHGKRRRSGTSGASFPSATPEKRRRTDAYTQVAIESDAQSLRTRGKGKRKASDEDNNDFLQHSSLFTVDETDSFNARPETPNPLEYVEPQAGPSFRSSPFPTMPQTSQMTLVETNPLPSPSTGMPKTSPNPAAQLEYEAEMQPLVSSGPVSPPRIHSSRQASEVKEDIPPSSITERVEASPVIIPTARELQPPLAKKRARRPKATVSAPTQFEAPYRNTRSRSRSVEPLAIPPPPAASKKSSKKKEKTILQLEPLLESSHEEDREIEAVKLLVAATGGNGLPEIPQPDAKMSPGEGAGPHSRSFDTDDEQTRRHLDQGSQQPLSQYPTSNYNLHPKEALKKFTATLPSTSQSRQSSIHPLQTSLLAQPRRGTSSTNHRIVELTSHPRTPSRYVQPRSKSSSSTESFPVVGTRASDTKKKYEQVEKRSPYKPLAGTRAAQHARLS